MPQKISTEEFAAIRQDDERSRDQGEIVDPSVRKLLDHSLALENDITKLKSKVAGLFGIIDFLMDRIKERP